MEIQKQRFDLDIVPTMASESSQTQDLIEQFCAITGATQDVGKQMIEVCHGNLDMAIGMHVDGEEAPGGGEGSRESAYSNISDAAEGASAEAGFEDDVRAPIPQKHEVLVHESYSFGLRGRRRQVRSVFDGFRDFQAEARQQELMQGAAGEDFRKNKKRRTLEDLFRPPIDLMHKGSFHTARDAGTTGNKWLMVNIQNVQEFACQTLNRDVWSNPSVKGIVKEHFIFWQVYHDSDEGNKYTQFYKVKSWPYIAIIDPRTGENMASWSKVDAVTFCDLVTEFLAQHPSPDGSSSSSPPKKKLKRSSSIIEASEDSQLEAAIKASLQETKSSTDKKNSSETEDNGSESDSSDLETFSDSGEETQGSPAKSRKSPRKSKDQSKNNYSSIFANKGKLKTDINGECSKESEENNSATDSKEEKQDQIGTHTPVEKSWKQYLGSEDDPCSDIKLRFPDNSREQFKAPCSSKLMALVLFVVEKGYSNERYELVTNFPRKKISYLDFDLTLKDAGLYPSETVFVQER